MSKRLIEFNKCLTILKILTEIQSKNMKEQ